MKGDTETMKTNAAEGLELPKLRCLRAVCGHEWTPRVTTPPEICPRCKSRKWNQPEAEDPADPSKMSPVERRIVLAFMDVLRLGNPLRVKALTRLIEAERELARRP